MNISPDQNSLNTSHTQKDKLTREHAHPLTSDTKGQSLYTKYLKYLQKFIDNLMRLTRECVIQLDWFIKYVINKQELDKDDVMSTARGPIIFGTYVIVIFVIIGGGWALIAPLDSAERAVGYIIPSSKRKIVQHIQGGVIKEIYVSLGDQVRSGEKIVALDEVQSKANYEMALNSYQTSLATEARLIAERDNLDEITFDDFLLDRKNDIQVATLIKGQELLFKSRKEVYNKTIEALTQKHVQLEKQLEGLIARRTSSLKNNAVNKEMLKSFQDLYKKGYLQKAKLLEMEAKDAESYSALLTLDSEIARIHESLTGDEAEILRVKSEYLARILEDLSKTHVSKNEALERYSAAKDGFDKIILRSPVDGTVIEMHATTIGGVFGPGAHMAEILPANDKLIVEARIASKDIASVHVGLKAKIRFSAFKSRTTPVFKGTVVSLSPDVVQDKNQSQMQEPAYIAKIDIDMDDFNKIAKKNKLVLRPGMQVEVNIVTGTRTLVRYLLDPVTDSIFKAFKEK